MTMATMARKAAEISQISNMADMDEGIKGGVDKPPLILPSYHSYFISNQFITYFQCVEENRSCIATSYAAIPATVEPAHGLPGDNVGKGIVAYPIEITSYYPTNEPLNRALGRRRSPLKGLSK